MGKGKGAAAAELALILPVLMVIVLLCVDFGRFACTYIAVTNAARTGAGYAIMHPELDSGSLASGVQQAARNELALQPGCDPSLLTTTTVVTEEPYTAQHPTIMFRVTVTASYNSFQPVVPWTPIPSSIPLSSSVEMRMIR
jgi:Flp pilus assembly protein TadG